jgi:hypothetical protein
MWGYDLTHQGSNPGAQTCRCVYKFSEVCTFIPSLCQLQFVISEHTHVDVLICLASMTSQILAHPCFAHCLYGSKTVPALWS